MSGALSDEVPPNNATTFGGEQDASTSDELMEYTVLDKTPPEIPLVNYMQSIGVIENETRRPQPGLASLQLIWRNHLVFYAQFTPSQVIEESLYSWRIVRINDNVIEDFLYRFHTGYPGSIARVVIHDTQQFFEVGELQENIRDRKTPDRFILWIHPREKREDDLKVSFRSLEPERGYRPAHEKIWNPYRWSFSEPVDESPVPGTPDSPLIYRSLIDRYKGFWSDHRDPNLRSMLRQTREMNEKTAYLAVLSIASTGQEIDSFAEFFRINPLKILDVIGIGSFGIAVAVKDTKGFVSVLKLIPLDDEKVIDILREVFITAQLSNYKPPGGEAWKFPAYYGCVVVKGGLSSEILSLLEGCEENQSFMRPDLEKWFVINLEYGGNCLRQYARAPEGHLELEHYGCALSILVQVINALAEAENEIYFEHRDCHWENILIFEDESITWDFMKIESWAVEASVRKFGVSVMLIDFGLARCNVPHGVEYADVCKKCPEILQQSGTMQYEVYKKMHEIIGEDWCRWRPETNALWIEYLIDKLLHRVAYKLDNHQQNSAYKLFIERFQQALPKKRGFHGAKEYRHLLCDLLLEEKMKTTSSN